MDGRAIVTGVVLTAAAIILAWFGNLPIWAYLLAGVGPFVAGFLSRSTDSKAFEGVAAVGGGYLLAIAGLAVGNYAVADALPPEWRFDVAFTTVILGSFAFVMSVPVSCVVGAALGVLGSYVNAFVYGGRPAA